MDFRCHGGFYTIFYKLTIKRISTTNSATKHGKLLWSDFQGLGSAVGNMAIEHTILFSPIMPNTVLGLYLISIIRAARIFVVCRKFMPQSGAVVFESITEIAVWWSIVDQILIKVDSFIKPISCFRNLPSISLTVLFSHLSL